MTGMPSGNGLASAGQRVMAYGYSLARMKKLSHFQPQRHWRRRSVTDGQMVRYNHRTTYEAIWQNEIAKKYRKVLELDAGNKDIKKLLPGLESK